VPTVCGPDPGPQTSDRIDRSAEQGMSPGAGKVTLGPGKRWGRSNRTALVLGQRGDRVMDPSDRPSRPATRSPVGRHPGLSNLRPRPEHRQAPRLQPCWLAHARWQVLPALRRSETERPRLHSPAGGSSPECPGQPTTCIRKRPTSRVTTGIPTGLAVGRGRCGEGRKSCEFLSLVDRQSTIPRIVSHRHSASSA
jgi:hypothetical protein